MLGTGAEMWGDAALGCKANERWNEGINPLGDKSVAAKKASLDYRKLVQELDTRLLHRAGLGAADPG